jgi:lysophosphatidate acyltransferase
MAKTSLKYTPLGPFMTLAGNIFIDRGNNIRAVRSVEAATQRMKKEKLSLWMYPEGTRHTSESPNMLPFKKGGFHLAINAGIPIVPIVIENYWRIYHKGVFDTGVIKVKSKETFFSYSLTLIFLSFDSSSCDSDNFVNCSRCA